LDLEFKEDRFIKDIEVNRDSQIRASLDEILTPEQRLAFVQLTYVHLLESDMFFILRPQVVKYLNMTEEQAASVKTAVEHWSETIKSTQKEQDWKIYDAGFAKLPASARKTTSELFADVWER
jgi:hypothetical protein